MVSHCLNGCVCPLACLHDANLDRPRAVLVKTDITTFSYLLGPYRCNSSQALMVIEVDWVWLGVPHPHRNTTPVNGSKASCHLDRLAFLVWLHGDPVIWSISPGWQPGPDYGFTLGWDGKGISAGYLAGVFLVPLSPGSVDLTAVC